MTNMHTHLLIRIWCYGRFEEKNVFEPVSDLFKSYDVKLNKIYSHLGRLMPNQIATLLLYSCIKK